jgi:succinoglycan biosynthesis protein ExoV
MKLYFWKTKQGNVGDDLNPWLFKKLLPSILNEKGDTTFVGIGTLLNDVLIERLQTPKFVVFSSGVGYGRQHFARLPQVHVPSQIYCLRGPLSCQALQVSTDLAITDGALLVRKLFDASKVQKKYKFAFMPHLWQAIGGGESWKAACDELGFLLIDPCWSVDKVLECIAQTEVLLTEAMHGAILADALRTPWVAVHTSSDVLGFKWLDWCLSVGVEYKPEALPRLKDSVVKKSLFFKKSMKDEKAGEVSALLAKIAQDAVPILSKDQHLDELTERLEEKIHQLKDDYAAGRFS